jgi:probable HAF family extracellular repeat protein
VKPRVIALVLLTHLLIPVAAMAVSSPQPFSRLAPQPNKISAPAVPMSAAVSPHTFAWDINKRGQVVGYSWTDAPFAAQSFLYDDGTRQDIGSLGGTFTEAVDINDRGEIVGIGVGATFQIHAFLWQKGIMTDLGPSNGVTSYGWPAINNQGLIVFNDAIPTNADSRAFLWEPIGRTDLGDLGGALTYASAINERGQVTGVGTTATGEYHAFLWDDGAMTDLGPMATPGYAALSGVPKANRKGQTVFTYNMADTSFAAILWDGNARVRLPDLGGKFSIPADINESGQVTGTSFPLNSEGHAVIWEDGAISDLGRGVAMAINNAGDVVIQRDAGTTPRAFLWHRGVLTDLGTLGGAWTLVHAINDRGQVIGVSEVASGEGHAFIWQDGVMTDIAAAGSSRNSAKGVASLFGDASPVAGIESGNVTRTIVGPNPFRGQVVMNFAVPKQGAVHVAVFDVSGRLVWHSDPVVTEPGTRRFVWNGQTESGRSAPAGIYLVRLTGNGFSVSKRIVREK